jgi:hypothetical protein
MPKCHAEGNPPLLAYQAFDKKEVKFTGVGMQHNF